MDEQTRRRVCLFGTSADPPTGRGGHMGIVQYLASLDDFDEVRILPVYSHMFGVSDRQNIAALVSDVGVKASVTI